MDRVAKTYISSVRLLGRLVALYVVAVLSGGKLRTRRGIWTSQARVDALSGSQFAPGSALVEQSAQNNCAGVYYRAGFQGNSIVYIVSAS